MAGIGDTGTENRMRMIRVEKITLNIGAGKDQGILEKGLKLLKNITGVEPVKTFTKKRIQAWGLRPGLPIGCKITLRGPAAHDLIKRVLASQENRLKKSHFDGFGNISFGIPECIDIPGTPYDPEIGIIGLEASITLDRPGFRVKKRMIKKAKVSPRHRITRDEAIGFMERTFGITVG
ncbi:50S ribosomal protein L5 [Candidatus Woesearchaeota archaeon]|nr:50S ribosomal protein L5 [Candidatus Woesearchaeota archaeon]